MEENSIENLNELQKKLLDILVWFHNFCIENQLRYYVLGGTMLGTMRHKGFIPWDDDIDVGMPREDYNRLIELLEDKQMDSYVLESPNSKKEDFIYPFAKLYDVRTTLVEHCRYDVKRGIYLDIFPLDGVGNDLSIAKKHMNKVFVLQDILALKISAFRKNRKFYKNFGVFLFRLIPNKCISAKKLIKKINVLCQEFDINKSTYGGNLFGQWRGNEIMESSIYGKPTIYKFHGYEIYGVEKPNEYLTNLYGNWQELPPKDKQVSHHDFTYIDLNKSYLES